MVVLVYSYFSGAFRLDLWQSDSLAKVAGKYSFDLETLSFTGNVTMEKLTAFNGELSGLKSVDPLAVVVSEKVSIMADSIVFFDEYSPLADVLEVTSTPCEYKSQALKVKSAGLALVERGEALNTKLSIKYPGKNYAGVAVEGIGGAVEVIDEFISAMGGICA